MYKKENSEGELLLVCIYVDDIVVMDSYLKIVNNFRLNIKSRFEMSDLGLMNYFLGLEVKQDKYGIHISQRKNTKDLLKDFNMLYCLVVPTPLNASIM